MEILLPPPPNPGIVRFADGPSGSGKIIEMGNRFTCRHAKQIGGDGAGKQRAEYLDGALGLDKQALEPLQAALM